MRTLLLVALLAAALRTPARAQVDWPLTSTTSTDSVPFAYSAVKLDVVPDSQCCAWRRWCPGGAVRFRCTAAVMTACVASNSTGPRCTACGVCAAAAQAFSGVALRASAPLSNASLACIDTLRPLKTARQSVLNRPVDPVPGAPPISGDFTVTQLGPAVPDAVLAPGAPRFVVCNRTAFKCVSMKPPGGDCQPVRGVRTPRAGSVFSRLWDTRGRSSRESANAGGTLVEAHAALVVNPLLWSYDAGTVATLQDRQVVEGNSDGGGACLRRGDAASTACTNACACAPFRRLVWRPQRHAVPSGARAVPLERAAISTTAAAEAASPAAGASVRKLGQMVVIGALCCELAFVFRWRFSVSAQHGLLAACARSQRTRDVALEAGTHEAHVASAAAEVILQGTRRRSKQASRPRATTARTQHNSVPCSMSSIAYRKTKGPASRPGQSTAARPMLGLQL